MDSNPTPKLWHRFKWTGISLLTKPSHKQVRSADHGLVYLCWTNGAHSLYLWWCTRRTFLSSRCPWFGDYDTSVPLSGQMVWGLAFTSRYWLLSSFVRLFQSKGTLNKCCILFALSYRAPTSYIREAELLISVKSSFRKISSFHYLHLGVTAVIYFLRWMLYLEDAVETYWGHFFAWFRAFSLPCSLLWPATSRLQENHVQFVAQVYLYFGQ